MLEKIVNELETKIEKSLELTDLENIFENLEQIKTPTLLCGIGGSHVVSTFLEKILTKKNNIIAKNIDAEEYYQSDFPSYQNLILVSHSGQNHAIKCLAKTSFNKYLLSTRKSKILDETLLTYSIDNRAKSFIAIDDTFIPMSILLCYYLNLSKVPFEADDIQKKYEVKSFNAVNIIYDYNTKTCATFLETSLVEAGISSVTMHTKYSLCHGRSNLISNKDSLVIYLVTSKTELDSLLLNELPKISKNILVLEDSNKDLLLADYNLTIKALHFLNYLNKTYNMEFVKVKYNQIVPTLYNFKGELK